MASFDDLKRHVMDDARELLVVVGIYTPLITDFAPETAVIGEKYQDVARFMRGHFGRQMLLLLERLHAAKPPRPERTGETASILTLLAAAEREGVLSAPIVAGFLVHRDRIREALTLEGVTSEAMKSLRDAEIGHSLHRSSTISDLTLRSAAILDHAHETYELVLAIERAWGDQSLDPWFHTSMIKGRWFWEKIGA